MFSRFRKKYQKEDGAYMVITALLLVAIIGMMVLAVDQGSWLSQKRAEQNAVDAAAVAAAQIYANDGSADQAVDAAVTAANGNGIVVTASDLVITSDNAVSPKKVKAVLTLDADNYFYNNGTAKNKTSVVVSSEAEIYETQTSGGSYIINPAIEANKLLWSGTGTADNEITGDIVIGNQGMTMTNPTTINGNISSDGQVLFNDGWKYVVNGNVNSKQDIIYNQPLTINGNLESLGNIQYMAGNAGNPNNIINGDVHANGNINIYNSTVRGNIFAQGNMNVLYDTINGDAIANGNGSVQNAKINGNVLTKGKLDFNDGTIVKKDVVSEAWTKINGGQTNSKVDGTFYINESGIQYDWQKVQNWQKEQMKKTDGSVAHFEDYSGQTVPTVSTVTHTDWVWNWDCLADTPSTAHKVVTGDLVGFANSKQGEDASAKWGSTQMCDRVSLHMTGNLDDKTPVTSIVFFSGYTFQKFVEYLQDSRGVSKTTPIYFPGSIRVQREGQPGKPNAFIVADNTIEWWSSADFSGVGGTSFLSINGEINIQGGNDCHINGAVITLNPNKGIVLTANAGGNSTVTGGVISHGTITMNGAWSIIADQNWQKYVPISGGTQTIKKVKLVS